MSLKKMVSITEHSLIKSPARGFFSKECGYLLSIAIRYEKDIAEGMHILPKSMLWRLWKYIEDEPGWLARYAHTIKFPLAFSEAMVLKFLAYDDNAVH